MGDNLNSLADSLYKDHPDWTGIAGIKEQAALMELHTALVMDTNYAFAAFQQDINNQFARRVVVRVAFSMIEGVVYALKCRLLNIHRYQGAASDLSVAEQAMLAEESYDLDERGKINARPNFPQVPKNIRFTLSLAARVWGIQNYRIDVEGQGWEALKQSVAIRNRITHPKHEDHLKISDAEIVQVNDAVMWFQVQYLRLMIMASKEVPTSPAKSPANDAEISMALSRQYLTLTSDFKKEIESVLVSQSAAK